MIVIRMTRRSGTVPASEVTANFRAGGRDDAVDQPERLEPRPAALHPSDDTGHGVRAFAARPEQRTDLPGHRIGARGIGEGAREG